MDTAAFALARENRIPIIVFSIGRRARSAAPSKAHGRYTLVTP